MHESILAFRGRRYLWLAIILLAGSIAAYLLQDPQEPANGGTLLGYVLGTLGALLVVWLTWFGIRKRRYASTAGTVQGWLSAHVYLGLALPVIVLLHAGFQLGANIHTLVFVLLLLVVLSGVYGVVIYLQYPKRVSTNRNGASRPELFAQLEDLDARSSRVAATLPAEFAVLVQSAATRTQLGGTLWTRLRGADNSTIVLPGQGQTRAVANAGQEAALDWLAEQQSRANDAEAAAKTGELSALLRNKRKLLRQIREDLRLQATMELWLYLHVPLTAGLLVALIAHIVTVFLYW
ncbi:MAG: hypothetical protein O2805_06445 [Proteobacteria bacterium]|nr:hypothetical protein [Pseudomonadota bacterium]